MLRREVDLRARDVYIGTTSFQDARIARVVPLAQARPGGWHPIEPSRFPDEGAVFSIDPKLVRKPKGYVALFTVAPSDRPGGRDRFVTSEVDEPYEILRELSDVSPSARRTALLQTGLDRGAQEESRTLVPMGEGEVAFPRLQRAGTGSRWTLSYQEESDRIEVFAVPAGGFREYVVDGRAFALPGRVPTRVVGCVNWQGDPEFLDYLVRKVRKAGAFASASDDFRITDRVVARLRAFYRDTDVVGERAGVNEAVRDRMGEFLAKLTSGATALAEIADALHGHREIQAALARLSEADMEALRERELDRLRPELTSRVEAELAERYAERDALRAEVEETAGRLEANSVALREIEALTGTGMASLRQGLRSYLDQIREAGSTLGRMVELAGPAVPSHPAETPREDHPWEVASAPGEPPRPHGELAAVAAERAKALGLSLDTLRAVDVLCRAGEIPTLDGDSVETTLSCYADLVAGGAIVRMPLDPGVLGADDVWRRPASGSPTAFADAWRSARASPDRFVLLCLDDLDRASLSDWFPRFRALYRAGRPTNLLVAATVAKGDDPDRGGCLATHVVCDGGRKAYLAAIVARERPPPRRFMPPERPALSSDELDTLLERLSGVGAGGDLGRRVLDVYMAARTWLEHEAACDFAAGMVVPPERAARKGASEGRMIPMNASADRKGQSS